VFSKLVHVLETFFFDAVEQDYCFSEAHIGANGESWRFADGSQLRNVADVNESSKTFASVDTYDSANL